MKREMKSGPERETKSLVTAIEIKASDDSKNGSFEGYAAAFGNVDSWGDIINPGAFTKTLAERSGQIKLLWNHDMFGLPIGIPTSMVEDEKGLYVTASFSATQMAQDIRTLVAEGAINSMSIGYSTVKSAWEELQDEYVRRLLEVKLYEVSLVNLPANPEATVTSAKSLGADLIRRASELDALVQVGIKSGRPLSAENLRAVQDCYANLGALLSGVDAPQETGDIVTDLKGFSLFGEVKAEANAIQDELAAALAAIKI